MAARASGALVMFLSGLGLPLICSGLKSNHVWEPELGRPLGRPHEEQGTLYEEQGRPQFHFTAAKNWINDPNGLVYYKGEYHLFFQHNPMGRMWGNMSWGHAVSSDLVHWHQLRNALLPDQDGHIWSGSAVVDWQNSSGLQLTGEEPPLVAFYTLSPDGVPAGRPFQQRMAFSRDKGRSWTKISSPALGPGPCKGLCPFARDPKVVRQGDRWIMVIWLAGNTFGLFHSVDLHSWKPLQELTLPHCEECPDLFELPGGHWVFWSACGMYQVGAFEGGRFQALGPERKAEYGKGYASQSYSDVADGRRIQVSWLPSCRWGDTAFTHQLSFPVELDLVELPSGLHLRRQPVSELKALRKLPSLLTLQQHQALTSVGGAGVELRLGAKLAPGSEVMIAVLGTQVLLRVNEDLHGSAEAAGRTGRTMPVHVGSSGLVNVSVLVDRRSLELYDMVGGASMAVCAALPLEKGEWKKEVDVHLGAGDWEVKHLEGYELQSALPKLKKGAKMGVARQPSSAFDAFEEELEQLEEQE